MVSPIACLRDQIVGWLVTQSRRVTGFGESHATRGIMGCAAAPPYRGLKIKNHLTCAGRCVNVFLKML